MKYLKFQIIIQFSLQCPKKTTCWEQSLQNDKKICLQIPDPTDRNFDVPEEFAPFLLQGSGKDDNERILIFGGSTMKNIGKLRSLIWLNQQTV